MTVIISNGLAWRRDGDELVTLSPGECASEIDRLSRELTRARSTLAGIRWECAVALDPIAATRFATAYDDESHMKEAINQMHDRYFSPTDHCREHGQHCCHVCAQKAGSELAALFEGRKPKEDG